MVRFRISQIATALRSRITAVTSRTKQRGVAGVLLDSVTVVVTVAALVVVTVRVREAVANKTPRERFPDRVSDWSMYANEGFRSGPDPALVTIVEFADFQCPFCSTAATYLGRLLKDFPNEVALVYRHFALHSHAAEAAIAAECARNVGLFDPIHTLLYRQRKLIGTRSWISFTREAGVTDTIAFFECMKGDEAAAIVARDSAAAARLGAPGTPTFLINDILVTGFPGAAVMDSVILSALVQAKRAQ